MSENEQMQVSPTGAKKAGNLQRVGLVPPEFILALSRHYGIGAKKYASHNWRGGFDWEWAYNAALRHILLFWQGEDMDDCKCTPQKTGDELPCLECGGTGSPHVIAAAWQCCALYIFMSEHPELDTRWSTVKETLQKAAQGET